MSKDLLSRLGFCLSVLLFSLYSYQNKQNELTELKMRLPEVQEEMKQICEENQRLRYEIERVESPLKLIELVHRPEFAYLKHPLMKEVFSVSEGIALHAESSTSSDLW